MSVVDVLIPLIAGALLVSRPQIFFKTGGWGEASLEDAAERRLVRARARSFAADAHFVRPRHRLLRVAFKGYWPVSTLNGPPEKPVLRHAASEPSGVMFALEEIADDSGHC